MGSDVPLGPKIVYTPEEAQALWQRGFDAGRVASPSSGPDHEKAALAAFDETMKAVEPWASGPVRSKHRAAFVRNLRAASPSPPELEESTWRSGPSPARRRHG